MKKAGFLLGAVSAAVLTLCAAGADRGMSGSNNAIEQMAREAFQSANPVTRFYFTGDRVTSVYGKAFSRGGSAVGSAELFRLQHSLMFGVEPEDLVPESILFDRRHTQPVMYDRDTGEYKFTLVYYSQYLDGVPVFRSDLRLLVRNEETYPLVLARSALRNLGDMRVAGLVEQTDWAGARFHNAARAQIPVLDEFTDPEPVIWAGIDDINVEPVLAGKFIASAGDVTDPWYQRWLFLVDAQTGEVVHRENLVLNFDIEGTVSGFATVGKLSSAHAPAELTAMPYKRISVVGGNTAFSTIDGDFVVPHGGTSPVTVQSPVRGQWFRVFNQAGTDTVLSESVIPPGPVHFEHNQSQGQFTTAEIDAYLHSNIVRDFTLAYHPTFPGLQQQEFTVNVNINNSCNAFYNGTSINFYRAGGNCPNTAYSSVVYHEYGHHLVNRAGSGQGQYGEGYSDTVANMIQDDHGIGYGFTGNPSVPLRSALAGVQYPCSGGIHACGRLLSGSVWFTRLALADTYPDPGDNTDLEVVRNLVINSVLLHTGTQITPQITIDFLVLDDDDGNILNGTPHYHEIDEGFGMHNMPAPPLQLLDFSFPDGLPSVVSPAGGTTFTVEVEAVGADPIPGSGLLHIDTGDGFTDYAMNEVSPNVYEAVFPAIPCGAGFSYYVSATTTDFNVATYPPDGPSAPLSGVSATSVEIAFEDDFADNKQGWVAGAPDDDATTGHWEWGDPIGTTVGGQQVQPDSCHTGQFCWFTGQHTPGQGAGFNDVDHGKTTLFTPEFDLSGYANARISYWRWYSNSAGANPNNDIFVVDISDDGGQTWVNAETVGPAGPQTAGGWFFHEFTVGDFVDLTDGVIVRFVASDYDPQALVEAALDMFTLTVLICEDPCAPDWNGDGVVDSDDLLDFLADWSAGNADYNGDGVTDSDDLLEFLSDWSAGC